jgi:hypothetical protein
MTLSLIPVENAMAYEEPDYEVISQYEEFEVRAYAPYVVAETYVDSDFSEAGSQAFRRLFAYISDDDRPQGKISMTTPVLQQPVPGETEATVDQEDRKMTSYRFAFVMPEGYSVEDLPTPVDAEVFLKEIPARTMTVRTYSGSWSEARYRDNEEALLNALQKEGLETRGQPLFARYNAPFSLWFLRRNEVLMEILP